MSRRERIEQRKKHLRDLTLGSSVAEFDNELTRHFLKTESYLDLINDRVDVVAGDKGSGKTALCRYICDNTKSIPELEDVYVVPGFNSSGKSIFLRLLETQALDRKQYITVWKAYILTLAGNWALSFYEGTKELPSKVRELDQLLEHLGLRSKSEKPGFTFSKVTAWLKQILKLKEVGTRIELNESGFPTATPYISFDENNFPSGQHSQSEDNMIIHEDVLALLDDVLRELDVTIWIMLDRLDEAFIGHPEVEIPALQALLRTYIDLQGFDRLRLKIFVRRDLFSRIVEGKFVNLTHVNARKSEIIWTSEDLFALMAVRIRESNAFTSLVLNGNPPEQHAEELFSAVFPDRVEPRGNQTTWQWMLTKTRDGNGWIQPRNLIDLAIFAREDQLKRESHSPFHKMLPLISAGAILNAFSRLSKERVKDTLLAEVESDVAACINGLRDGKAEHNDETLANAFSVRVNEIRSFVDVLMQIGFLAKRNGSYVVPILYRGGLNIKMGKAFKPTRNHYSPSARKEAEPTKKAQENPG